MAAAAVQENRGPASQADVLRLCDERVGLPEFAKRLTANSVEQFSGMSQDPRQFIFEMVQNVDDTPHRADVIPSITFAIAKYDSRGGPLKSPMLLIMSEQDGFTVKDVEGICTVADGRNRQQAEGAKSGATGECATGEKGIGFKSVRTRVPILVMHVHICHAVCASERPTRIVSS